MEVLDLHMDDRLQFRKSPDVPPRPGLPRDSFMTTGYRASVESRRWMR
jgi:hypothetical protein